MSRILGVGIATLDIINSVDHYPEEDEELRATSQRVVRGGNCTNTLTVLARLGHHCHWSGVLADEPDGQRITAELAATGIDYRHCLVQTGGKVPTSYITLNQQNGSRTIVHYRDLSELPYSHFATLGLHGYDWFHFEGRNLEDTAQMLRLCRQTQPHTPISLEVEKPRPGIEALFELADVLLFSKAYARHLGYTDAEAFLKAMRTRTPRARLYCGWGDQGAYGMDQAGALYQAAAYPPARVVDTLGAGDTLNAALIHGELQRLAMAANLDQACRLAGAKCGVVGWEIPGIKA